MSCNNCNCECKDGICRIDPIPFSCCVSVTEGFEPVFICQPCSENKATNWCKPLIIPLILDEDVRVCLDPAIVRDVPILTDCGKISCDVPVKKLKVKGDVEIKSALLTRKCNQYKFSCCVGCVHVNKTICIKCFGCKSCNTSKTLVRVDIDSLDVEELDSCTCDTRFKIMGFLKICIEFSPCIPFS